MLYAVLTSNRKREVVYVLAFEGGHATVLHEDGSLDLVKVTDLKVADANGQTPFANWPDLPTEE